MTYVIHQNRVSLRNLQVAEFASEETLCFSATVLLDGKPIAEARADGHGGCTFLRPLKRNHAKLAEAEAFAKSLPPVVIEDDDPSRAFTLDVTLDFLVDHLASEMHSDRKLYSMFKRDITTKVLCIRDDKLLYLRGVRLNTLTDRPAGAIYSASVQVWSEPHHPCRASPRGGVPALEASLDSGRAAMSPACLPIRHDAVSFLAVPIGCGQMR